MGVVSCWTSTAEANPYELKRILPGYHLLKSTIVRPEPRSINTIHLAVPIFGTIVIVVTI